MTSKSLLLVLCTVLALSLAGVTVTSAEGGQAQLVIINFVGAEMIFTLDGTPYTIPGTDTAPDGGQLSLTLTPGRHTYSGHVPGSEGTNGEVELASGETQVLGARLDRSDPVISSADVVLEEPRDVLVFFEASLTPAAPRLQPQPTLLRPLPAGQGALVFVNFIGEELLVDIGGTLSTVPANSRLQIDLPSGEVSYSASAGVSGINGTAQVTAGDYAGLGFSREFQPEDPDYEVGKPVPTPVPLKISVFPVPLEDEPVAQAEIAAPDADEPETPIPVSAGQGALSVVNYVGETLTFTIEDQAYQVARNGGRLAIDLSPGDYTFSASTPHAGENGSLQITQGAATQVSVALDVQSGEMTVFVE